jgi:hypothetical protein
MQGYWVVEIGWWMARIEGAGDICLRRPRPNQGCRADDDDDDDDDGAVNITSYHVLMHVGKTSSCLHEGVAAPF